MGAFVQFELFKTFSYQVGKSVKYKKAKGIKVHLPYLLSFITFISRKTA